MKTARENKSKRKSGIKNIKYLGGSLFTKMAKGGGSELRSNADEVNKLNVFPVPDGDTGDNMRMTIESGIAAIENLNTDDLAYVMKLFSHGMLIGARGNSGVILSQFFAGMANALKSESQAEPATLAKALQMGVMQAYTSVMTPTEGTILTVAREAVEYAVSKINEKSTVRSLFADLVREMQRSLNRTPEILAVLKEAGVVDSGGAGLYYIMDGFNRVLNGEEIADGNAPTLDERKDSPAISEIGPDMKMTYGYCTEFLLQLQNEKTDIQGFDIENFKRRLSSLGDSLVAFKTDTAVKVHLHTMTPEKALSYARNFGEFITVKIENMSLQHTESKDTEKKLNEKKKKFGIVAVSCGAGISSVFKELGADEIVLGGQTNNPSIKDFLDAYERVNAQHIFVLPNNSNLILAAEQSAKIYKKAKIHIIPAKNTGAGYAALSYAKFDAASPKKFTEAMLNAIASVKNGYISPAIRDAEINGISVKVGDTVGIIEKELVISAADRFEAISNLIDMLSQDSLKTVLSIFYGKDSAQNERKRIEAYVKESHPQLEVYFIDGAQDVMPYIFSIE